MRVWKQVGVSLAVVGQGSVSGVFIRLTPVMCLPVSG